MLMQRGRFGMPRSPVIALAKHPSVIALALDSAGRAG